MNDKTQLTLNVFSIDYQTTAISSLQSCDQLTESRVSNQRLVWLKLWLKLFECSLNHFFFSSVSSLQSSVVEVLADQKRKGRPPKPDRPSASEKKFPCVFCEKRYGTKQSLQVKITIYNRWISLCSICISGSCFYKAPSREESTARPSNGNVRFYCLICL